MSVPVFLKIIAQEDRSVSATLQGLESKFAAVGSNAKLDIVGKALAPDLLVVNKLLAEMQAEASAVARELGAVKDQLAEAGNVQGLGAQTAAYEGIRSRLEAIGQESGEVLSRNTALQSSFRTLTSSAEAGLRSVENRAQALTAIVAAATGAFAGTGAVLAGLAGGTLAVASTFEQLQQKLVSVTGSTAQASEAFSFIREFAATTPFDVEGLVRSATVIRGFQQDIESLLPVAANLAAAMGVDLNEATLALSRAAAGSPEGWQSLRDTLAITSNELEKYGGVLNKTTGQMSIATRDVEANRNALIRLVNTKYGDAIARQSDTLAGAMSNVGDAVKNAAAGFGQFFVPSATQAARFTAGLIGTLDGVPPVLKGLGAAAVLAGLGLAGVGTVIAGGIGIFVALQAQLVLTVAQLEALKVSAPGAAAALNVMNVAAGRVGGSLTAANLASAASRLAFLGLAGVATAAALAIADSWQKSAEQVGDAIRDSSRSVATASKAYRDAIRDLNTVGKEVGVSVSIVGDAGQQFAQLQAAFSKLTPDQTVTALEKMGVGAEQLKGDLKALEQGANDARDRLNLLRDAQAALDKGKAGGGWADFNKVGADLQRMGIQIDDGSASFELLQQRIREASNELARFGAGRTIVQNFLAAFDQVNGPLEKAIANAKALSPLLDLSKSVGSAQALSGALSDVNQAIAENARLAQVGSDNLDTLFSKLRDPKVGETQRNAILEQIGLIQQRGSIEEAQARLAADTERASADAAELALRRRKAQGLAGLQDELSFVEQRLAAVREGSEEEVRLLEQAADLRKQIRDKEVADTKAAIDAINSAVGAGSGILKAGDAQRKADEAKDKKAKSEALGGLNTGLDSAVTDAANPAAKLAALEQGIKSLQSAKVRGLVDEEDAQKRINDLSRQKAALERQINQDQQQRATAIAQLELQGLEQQVELIKAKATGKTGSAKAAAESEIAKVQEQAFKKRLEIIDQERQAAVQGAQGQAEAIEQINRQYDLKRQQAVDAETLKRIQAAQAQEKAVTGSLDRIDQRVQQSFARLGGANSPLQSLEEAFAGFSLGNFSLDLAKKPTPPKPSINLAPNIEQTVFTQANGPARGGDAGGKQGPGGSAGAPTGRGPGQQPSGSIQNYHVSINGTQVAASDPRFFAAVTDVIDHHARATKLRRS